jgi:SH3 domain-containing YSC84-like protein 1
MKRSIAVAAIMFLAATSSPATRSDDSHEKKLRDASSQSAKAATVLDVIMQVPDRAIPRELMTRAKAIAVFPQVIKVALKVGGEGGRGVVSRRTSAGWADPVFLRAGGGSVGPQVGASSTDFVLLLMSDESVKGLMKDRFELGGEAAVAAGPVGRNAGAGTDVLLRAEILSYSRSRGLFAGANLKGVVLQPEDDLNVAVYHKTASALLADEVPTGSDDEVGLKAFPQALGRYTDSADR